MRGTSTPRRETRGSAPRRSRDERGALSIRSWRRPSVFPLTRRNRGSDDRERPGNTDPDTAGGGPAGAFARARARAIQAPAGGIAFPPPTNRPPDRADSASPPVQERDARLQHGGGMANDDDRGTANR